MSRKSNHQSRRRQARLAARPCKNNRRRRFARLRAEWEKTRSWLHSWRQQTYTNKLEIDSLKSRLSRIERGGSPSDTSLILMRHALNQLEQTVTFQTYAIIGLGLFVAYLMTC